MRTADQVFSLHLDLIREEAAKHSLPLAAYIEGVCLGRDPSLSLPGLFNSPEHEAQVLMEYRARCMEALADLYIRAWWKERALAPKRKLTDREKTEARKRGAKIAAAAKNLKAAQLTREMVLLEVAKPMSDKELARALSSMEPRITAERVRKLRAKFKQWRESESGT
jgi:hypothetical protein